MAGRVAASLLGPLFRLAATARGPPSEVVRPCSRSGSPSPVAGCQGRVLRATIDPPGVASVRIRTTRRRGRTRRRRQGPANPPRGRVGKLGEVSTLEWVIAGVAITVAVYAIFVLALVIADRRSDARALATFIPDCLVLFKRLLADRRVSGWRKGAVVALVAYLAMPFDLVPDFIPVAGQLDDAIVVALVLRIVVRSGGPELLREHWPGPRQSLAVVMRCSPTARKRRGDGVGHPNAGPNSGPNALDAVPARSAIFSARSPGT